MMSNEHEIIVQERPQTLPEQVPAQVWAERRTQFNDWVNTQLREGVDYGLIPGTNKPSLWKPGAEKIAQVFGCAPELEFTVRDQESDTGYLYIEVVVRLVSLATGTVVAVGVGSCCSYESRYRYRWEWWNRGGNPTAEGGWEQTQSGKWRRRRQNPDLIDQWNTVLKMAKKRGLVDAALTLSGASEKFTQDIEDVPAEPAEDAPAQRTRRAAPKAEAQSVKGNGPKKRTPATDADKLAAVWDSNADWIAQRLDEIGVTDAEALKLSGLKTPQEAGTPQDYITRVALAVADATDAVTGQGMAQGSLA